MSSFTLLSLVGLVLIITRSSIMDIIKKRLPLGALRFSDCPMCIGFWVGFFYQIYQSMCFVKIPEALLVGFLVSLVSYILIIITDSLAKYLES